MRREAGCASAALWMASVLLLLTAPRLEAQGSAGCGGATPVATLQLWAEDVWLALTDRDGSYFGRLGEQGTFQRFNPLMDTEYELDLRTGLFGPGEDAGWAPVARGVRVAGASINHPFILNHIDWREEIPIAGAARFLARYRRQRSLHTQRDYPQVGVAVGGGEGSWGAAAFLGAHFFKPSADVEFGLLRHGVACSRALTLDVRLAVLDAFNNVIFNALGVRPEETAAHFDYRRQPVAVRASVTWRGGAGRVEAHLGTSSRTEVLVSFPASGAPSYTLFERVSFLGVLAEGRASARATVAAYGTVARATTDRASTPAAASDFGLRETTRSAGGRGRWMAGRDLAVETEVAVTWRPEVRLPATGAEVRHRDREMFALVALAGEPATGWGWRLGYAMADRRAGVLAPGLTSRNHRQLMEGGRRFASGFDVRAGVRWDLDRFTGGIFDGGHVRLSASW